MKRQSSKKKSTKQAPKKRKVRKTTDLPLLSLREIRELFDKSQVEFSEMLHMSQGEISRLERRQDHRVSTLHRYVGALGGTLDIVVSLPGKKVRLKS